MCNMFSISFLIILCSALLAAVAAQSTRALPTLYEYYTTDGITTGLSADQPYFTLNNKNISIYSGAMHYFRIPREHWRDRLRKLRAAGLNTVETYVPWNLHEWQNGIFDFGDGGTDLQDFLNIQEYLRIAQEEDLFAIVRPGPYICAEWEWGGLPSWLLREDGIRVRTSETKYMSYVKRYFDMLLPLLVDLQFTNGGPIIAFQVENEYGFSPDIDIEYIKQLVDIYKNNSLVELFVTSDGASSGQQGTLPGTLFQTVNFGSDPKGSFDSLNQMQPDKPIMAMEFYPGWFDHWTEAHHTVSNDTFRDVYGAILTYPASVNIYMFHGGTNWGFLNGANYDNGYAPTTTSYDYDAPLSEAGDYTAKYEIVKELLKEYNPIETLTPDPPELKSRKAYTSIPISGQIQYEDIVEQAPITRQSIEPLLMEYIDINNSSGQSYGWIIYRKGNIALPANSVLEIQGQISDSIMVLVNGELISNPLSSSDDLNGFGYWRLEDSTITLNSESLAGATLDLVVENWGRVNFGNIYQEFKGLKEDNKVLLNGEELINWLNIPLEFKRSWNNALDGWQPVNTGTAPGPGLYRAILTIEENEEPQDTYINMEQWTKGVVIVNGFVLGRYILIGPQQTLYLPAPFLHTGDNEIIVFEQFVPVEEISFVEDPIFYTR